MSSSETNPSISILLDHQYLGTPVDAPSDVIVKTEIIGKDSNEVPDENSLNATSIQQCFQNMLNMTALSDLDSRKQAKTKDSGNCKVVRVEPKKDPNSDIKESKGTSSAVSTKSNLGHKNCNKMIKGQQKSIKEDREKDDKPKDNEQEKLEDAKRQREWIKLNRDYQEEVRHNALLQYTMSLLVKRWAEYLDYPTEKINSFEIENARKSGLTDDVIEMMNDKDRHVWQILDTIGED